MQNAEISGKMRKKRKKIEIFSIFDWKTGLFYAILTVLFAQSSLLLRADDVHREGPKPAWQLEKELAALKQESEEKLAKLPVHVVTADTEMPGKYRELGFDGMLLKPVTVEKLKELIG